MVNVLKSMENKKCFKRLRKGVLNALDSGKCIEHAIKSMKLHGKCIKYFSNTLKII